MDHPTADLPTDPASTGGQPPLWRRVLTFLLVGFGLFLTFRAVMELFVVDFNDPSDYSGDWGGPSLWGVLAVHMVPGIVSAVLIVIWARRRRQRRMG